MRVLAQISEANRQGACADDIHELFQHASEHASQASFAVLIAYGPTISTPFNARSEEAYAKPMFRGPFKSKRCLVPATAFLEWQVVAGQKKKQKIRKPYFWRSL